MERSLLRGWRFCARIGFSNFLLFLFQIDVCTLGFWGILGERDGLCGDCFLEGSTPVGFLGRIS